MSVDEDGIASVGGISFASSPPPRIGPAVRERSRALASTCELAVLPAPQPPPSSVRFQARYCAAMSAENVEIVRRGWEAYEGGDPSGALEMVSPEMVTNVAPPIPVAGTYHGPEGFLQLTIDWAEGFDDLVITGQEFIDAGDQVVVRSLHKSEGAASGVPVETDAWYVFTVREEKVVRVDIFYERAEALEAAGLSE